MPIPKPKSSSTTDVLKTENGNDSIDTIIRQAVGKEPFLSFSRASESPVQWIQLLHALDQQEHPGWPLLSPLKIQLQKCDKCSREFCSPINYRRHIRVHHRLKKLDKDSTKNRDLLGAYWDKLSEERAKEVISFKNVMLEDTPGSSILKSLTTLIRKPGFSSLPQSYLKAGSALLDIVQARSRFPITSQELFSVLDDASEKTFLRGPPLSMQKYVFDGEAGKIGLEPKNLIACTSFLLEQRLAIAWLADKDAEALRCQKLLVEEEEAAQKRQAEILERKRQKKLKQKEQKAKEQRHEDDLEMIENISNTVEAVSPAEASLEICDFEAHNANTGADHVPLSLASFQCPNTTDPVGEEFQSGYDCGCTDPSTDHNIEQQTSKAHNHQHSMAARQRVPKSQWAVANGFHTSRNSQILKNGVVKKHGTQRDQRAAPLVNGTKVWSRKREPEIDGALLKARLKKEPDHVKNHEVLIGSISVTLGNCGQSEGNLLAYRESCMEESLAKHSSVNEKPIKFDSIQSGNNPSTVKLWRPVSQHGTKDSVPVQNGSREVDMEAINGNGEEENLSDWSCLRPLDVDNSVSGFGNNCSHREDNLGPGSLRLSSHAAKAFLAQRWKQAISSTHVKLVLSPASEHSGCQGMQDYELAASQSSKVDKCSIFASSENTLVGAAKSKQRMKPEKVVKMKYIPKQRTAAQ